MVSDKDIAKLMEQAPNHVKTATPCRRPTTLDLRMGKARADEWRASKAAEEAELCEERED